MTIGEKIKIIRKKNRLTQKELGDKLGVSYQMIAQYENGKRNPKIETVQKIADALDMSICYTEDGEPCFIDKIYEGTGQKAFESISIREQEIYKKIAKMPEITPDTVILDLYHQLNDAGQDMAVEQVELLTKIPEDRKKSPQEHIPILKAAHERTDIKVTDEMRKHDCDIMEDDTEWKEE